MQTIKSLISPFTLHSLIMLVCWGLPTALFVAQISKGDASFQTWGLVANQASDMLFGVNIWLILITPILWGLIVSVMGFIGRLLESK